MDEYIDDDFLYETPSNLIICINETKAKTIISKIYKHSLINKQNNIISNNEDNNLKSFLNIFCKFLYSLSFGLLMDRPTTS